MGTKTFEFGIAVAGSDVSTVSAVRERVNHLLWPTSAGVWGELCPQAGRGIQSPVTSSQQGTQQRPIQATGLPVAGRPAGVLGYASAGIRFSTDSDAARFMTTLMGSGVGSGTG